MEIKHKTKLPTEHSTFFPPHFCFLFQKDKSKFYEELNSEREIDVGKQIAYTSKSWSLCMSTSKRIPEVKTQTGKVWPKSF